MHKLKLSSMFFSMGYKTQSSKNKTYIGAYMFEIGKGPKSDRNCSRQVHHSMFSHIHKIVHVRQDMVSGVPLGFEKL